VDGVFFTGLPVRDAAEPCACVGGSADTWQPPGAERLPAPLGLPALPGAVGAARHRHMRLPVASRAGHGPNRHATRACCRIKTRVGGHGQRYRHRVRFTRARIARRPYRKGKGMKELTAWGVAAG